MTADFTDTADKSEKHSECSNERSERTDLNRKVGESGEAAVQRELRGFKTLGTFRRVSLPIVSAAYLQRRATVAQARWLLGKHLVRRHADGRMEARIITETEAYDGERDLACHARVGRTTRTEVMYAAGGVWYVYLCYGVHEMLNLVVGPAEWPAAVLIRGLEGVSGPGRLTRALGIGRHLNGAAACDPVSGLWLEDRGVRVAPRTVVAGPRVGVEFAGPVWGAKPWRFSLNADPRGGPARPRAPTRG